MTSAEPIYTLADLDAWSFAGTALAVVGHPIKHSLSPPMHNAALAKMAEIDARFASWKYFRFDIAPEALPAALQKFHARGFKGLNLTVPHKIIAYNLADVTVSESVDPIGAVNTLAWNEAGWTGYNTDGCGLAQGIQEDLCRDLRGTHILLLGAGGAARGAAVECLQRGCFSLTILNRTQSAMTELIGLISLLDAKVPLRGIALEDLSTVPAGVLVINATTVGLKPDDAPPVNLRLLTCPVGVYDMIYNPPETTLLAQARALGLPAANGLSMLVHQGARALEVWSQAAVPVDAMRQAVVKAMDVR